VSLASWSVKVSSDVHLPPSHPALMHNPSNWVAKYLFGQHSTDCIMILQHLEPAARADTHSPLHLLQRLSLDANMLRGAGEAQLWGQNHGASFGGTARHSDTVNYAGALGHAPSNEYVVNVNYCAGADIQAQGDGSGDQLGPLPTQVPCSAKRCTPCSLSIHVMLAPSGDVVSTLYATQ
jgi:hypothetical protein